jgi:acyl-CoA thioesterase
MHAFDTATTLTPLPDGSFRGRTTAAYANMVGPFGGTTAACMLQAAAMHPARLGDPISLTVNFAAALADGEFDIVARAARTNRSTQHWVIELTQAGETAATATAVFAVRRESWSELEAAMPQVAERETLARAPTEGRPQWTRQYDMRFARGGMPDKFDEIPHHESLTQVWVRDEPPRPLDFISLAALCDTFFPRVFMRRRKWLPIGTVSLTTFFHADAELLIAQGERAILGVAQGVNFRNGYFDQSATMWSDDGQLLASSHQIVYYRA